MSRRCKYQQQRASGCKVCGDTSIGRGIRQHVESHGISYDAYQTCFEKHGEIIFDELKDTGKRAGKGTRQVILHVLVRRFEVPIQ